MNIQQSYDMNLIQSIVPWLPDPTHTWLLIIDKNIVVGCYELHDMTRIMCNVHLHIKKEHNRKGYGIKSYWEFVRYLISNTPYLKAMCTIAENNVAMIQGLKKTKWKACGLIKDGCIHQDKLSTIIIFEHDIK